MSEHSESAKPRIVLVHGAWADGTGWQHVIPLLEEDGYPVIAVQNPLTSFADDIATTKRVIDAEAQKGPVVVVGHSYGGAVITGAADNPNVKALVYIAAFAPEANEPVGALLGQFPPTPLGAAFVPDAAGFVYIDRAKFRAIFAADVDRTEARVMAAAQKPASGAIFSQSAATAAWKTIPQDKELPLSALKSAFPVLSNPFNLKRAVSLTAPQFRFGFTNAVSEQEAKEMISLQRHPVHKSFVSLVSFVSL